MRMLARASEQGQGVLGTLGNASLPILVCLVTIYMALQKLCHCGNLILSHQSQSRFLPTLPRSQAASFPFYNYALIFRSCHLQEDGPGKALRFMTYMMNISAFLLFNKNPHQHTHDYNRCAPKLSFGRWNTQRCHHY